MKTLTQIEAMKSVRKPCPPPTRIERPEKGCGYNRKKKHKKMEDFD